MQNNVPSTNKALKEEGNGTGVRTRSQHSASCFDHGFQLEMEKPADNIWCLLLSPTVWGHVLGLQDT